MSVIKLDKVTNFIKNLKKSFLVAECSNCHKEFSLSKALLFDGRKPFPDAAELTRLHWEQELGDRISKLKKKKERATKGSEKASVAVGLGKMLEKILPVHKNFDMVPSDCRFLAAPIDLIGFNGLSVGNIDHISFMEVKSNSAKLNDHQKMIRDAINDHQVKWSSL